jgi:sugar phosphate isomerase/epimerase
VADGAAIVRDVNNPGAAVMGDFWHMTWEETNDRAAFLAAGDYLRHVHIASRKRRKMPGEDGEADNYINGFRGLKEINYQDYVSFECGSVGDSKITLPAAVKLMREQWKKA